VRPAFADQTSGFRRYDLVQLVPMTAAFFEREPADHPRVPARHTGSLRGGNVQLLFFEAPFLRLKDPLATRLQRSPVSEQGRMNVPSEGVRPKPAK